MSIVLRPASSDDIPSLRALDVLCFPPGRSETEPAAPGELEAGVEEGQVIVASLDGAVVGFIQYSLTGAGGQQVAFILGAAVHPDARGRGLAGQLVRDALAAISGSGSESVATTTAPDNVSMIHVLCRSGFVGTTFIPNYFGAGKDRLYFELRGHDGYRRKGNRLFLPVTNDATGMQRLLSDQSLLTDIVQLPHGPHYEISRELHHDERTVIANEVATSAAFAGAVLASLTFLFGFAITNNDISADVVGAVGASLLTALLALVAYTNSSGELARLRKGDLERFMRVGDVVSEFAGTYALFCLTPALLISATDGAGPSAVVAAAATILLAIYHFSDINMVDRYVRGPMWTGLKTLLAAVPLLAYGAWEVLDALWPWTVTWAFVSLVMTAGCLRATETS